MKGQTDTNQKLAYSVSDLVKASGRSRSAIYHEIGVGSLKARKAGRRTIILHVDAVAWLEALPLWESQQQAA